MWCLGENWHGALRVLLVDLGYIRVRVHDLVHRIGHGHDHVLLVLLIRGGPGILAVQLQLSRLIVILQSLRIVCLMRLRSLVGDPGSS